jgi:hypothetical protein
VAAAGLPPGVKIAESYELAQPGQKDGETKIVREGDGSIAAYGWDAGRCVWEKIGTVVDAPEPGEAGWCVHSTGAIIAMPNMYIKGLWSHPQLWMLPSQVRQRLAGALKAASCGSCLHGRMLLLQRL